MKQLQYTIAKIISRLKHEKYNEYVVKYFRRLGVEIGEGTYIYSNILTPEPFLIHIGRNCTVSTEVAFVTHDNSISHIDRTKANLFGHITIGDNCFIGERAMLMYGVTLCDDIIVASGSIVTRSFDTPRVIIGGNPARVIGTWDSLYERYGNNAMGSREIQHRYLSDNEKLIKRKVNR